jgi:hypothetical protein
MDRHGVQPRSRWGALCQGVDARAWLACMAWVLAWGTFFVVPGPPMKNEAQPRNGSCSWARSAYISHSALGI